MEYNIALIATEKVKKLCNLRLIYEKNPCVKDNE